MDSHFILYVKDQALSTEFYKILLNKVPRLNVPGMTEFQLAPSTVLGLMPESGVKKLLGDSIKDPCLSNGQARCELYLKVKDPETYLENLTKLNAPILSPLQERSWGDQVAYAADPDGNIIGIAKGLLLA